MATVKSKPGELSITIEFDEFFRLIGGTITERLKARMPNHRKHFDECKVSKVEVVGGKVVVHIYNNYDKIMA